MRGDFSRVSYNPAKGYTGVRMQQGRVQLDADWNEQMEIVQHQIEAPLGDLLGELAVQQDEQDGRDGFGISLPGPAHGDDAVPDFAIAPGVCYVDGIRCVNARPCHYSDQPDYPAARDQLLALAANHRRYIVYLDVWQRLVTRLEDDAIHEIALEGADTCVRTKTVWQVKLEPVPDGQREQDVWAKFKTDRGAGRGTLRVQTTPHSRVEDNQLYRVEIHQATGSQRTFKVSRENGSVAYAYQGADAPVTGLEAGKPWFEIHLAEVDVSRVELAPDDWVELGNERNELNGAPATTLYKVRGVRDDDDTGVWVRLWGTWPDEPGRTQPGILRRWDQREAWVARTGLGSTGSGGTGSGLLDGLLVDTCAEQLHDLENGIQVQFSQAGTFQPYDYWLIPTRSQVNSEGQGILWPVDSTSGQFVAQPPHGIDHRYGLLGVLKADAGAWAFTPTGGHRFATLPALKADQERLAERVATLDAKVEQLEQQLLQLQDQVEHLRHRLFQEFRSPGHLDVGDLVAIHDQGVDAVVAATRQNERRVLGVVMRVYADDPKDPGPVQVALHGLAKCAVVGDVTAGDLLVVSDVEKCAQRAGLFIRPGTVVGKALSGRTTGAAGVEIIDILITL